MAPPLLHTLPPLLPPTAGGESRFLHMHALTHTHTHTHLQKNTHTQHSDHFIINPILFFWPFFFVLFFSQFSMLFFSGLIISSVLLCSRQATLSYCSPEGWGPATFHQHLAAYLSTLSAWGGKRCGLKLRKPAGCQQTSICKLGLRNVRLLTKRKASGVVCFSVCSNACVHEKHRTSFVQASRAGPHTQPLLLLGGQMLNTGTWTTLHTS